MRWIGWLLRGVELAGVVVVVVPAPLAAVYALVTGERDEALAVQPQSMRTPRTTSTAPAPNEAASMMPRA
jgi:hypothetical protein